MALKPALGTAFGVRRIGPVAWSHDGHVGISVTAGNDVPSCDDSMILGALNRGIRACERTDILERVINRELWAIGYFALLEPDVTDHSRLMVRIASAR